MSEVTVDFEVEGLRAEITEHDDGRIQVSIDWDEGSPWAEILADKTPEEVVEILITRAVEEEARKVLDEAGIEHWGEK